MPCEIVSTSESNQKEALCARLSKITGQLRSVERMISEDSYDCAAVLNVLVSARRAVKSLSEKIITDHIEHCLKPDAPEGTCRAQLKEIQTMLRRYVE